jgi:DNA-binding response OmpR family regulator
MHRHRVLLVDDDAGVARTVLKVARHLGLSCVAADDPGDAVTKLATEQFCVALVGLSPAGDALLQYVRDHHLTIPVVALTEPSQPVGSEQLDGVGVRGIITKPLNLELLRLAVAAACLRAQQKSREH